MAPYSRQSDQLFSQYTRISIMSGLEHEMRRELTSKLSSFTARDKPAGDVFITSSVIGSNNACHIRDKSPWHRVGKTPVDVKLTLQLRDRPELGR